MKNAFIALALVLVCTTAFASKSADTKARLQKISSSAFGRTILETIQVELKSKDDPRPRIIELLEELQNQLVQDQATADDDFNASKDQHDGVVDNIQSELHDLSESLAASNQAATDLQTSIDQAEADLSTQTDLISTLQSQLDADNAAFEAVEESFETADRKYGRILEVLGQVRGVITQRLANRYNAEFLQSGHKQLMSAFAEIKSSLNDKAFKRMSPGFSRLISFIAAKVEAHLTQDESQEDQDAEAGLTSIVTLIDSIASGVEQERVATSTFYNQAKENNEAVNADLGSQISNAQSAVDNLNTQLTDLAATLATTEGDISHAEARVAELEGQLEAENSAFDALSASYSSTTHDRTEQLGLIQEVLDIVQHQLSGLRQYAEDYIANN